MEKYQGLPQEYCQQLHQLLEQLFNDCYRSLVGQADYIIDDHPAAEDIVMEVFKKVWERLTHEKIGKDELTEAYLKKAVRNGCLTWLDKRKNQTSLSRDISDPLAEEKTNEKEQWSLWLLIVEWIEGLPKQQRQVMIALFFEDKKPLEVAKAMNLSRQTVYRHRDMAIDSIRQKARDRGIPLDPVFICCLFFYSYSLN